MVPAALGVLSLAIASGWAAPPAVLAPSATVGDGADRPPGMVWIPGGTFTMGSEPGPGVRPDESPSHPVRVKGFWIDRTEVTNRQFAEFVRRPAT